MRFNALIPELTVSDIEKSKLFYIQALGFHLEYERPEDGFIFLSLEENQLMLEQDRGNWQTGELAHPYGRGVNFSLAVSDVAALYARVCAAGLPRFRELTENRYRTGNETIAQKEFLLQDPDGYLLRFTD